MQSSRLIELSYPQDDEKSESESTQKNVHYTCILDEKKYNELLENTKKLKQLTETLVTLEKQMIDLRTQLEESVKQKEGADFNVLKATEKHEHLQTELKKTLEENETLKTNITKLTKAIKKLHSNQDKIEEREKEVTMHLNAEKYFKEQCVFLENALYRKQQELDETRDLLKQTESELDESRQCNTSLNESFTLEQQAHKETLEQKKSIGIVCAKQLQQQAKHYEDKLFQAYNEINSLKNILKQNEQNKLYSSIVKRNNNTIFKDSKIPVENDKNKNLVVSTLKK